MISKEEVRSKLMKASIRGRAKAPEVHFHLEEAYTCLENELYIASCLCSITFIDITMRYLDAVLENTEIINGKLFIVDPSMQPTLGEKKYMGRDMLRRLQNKGIDISPLALEGVSELDELLKKKDNTKPMIRNIRDDLCHGNLSQYFEARTEGNVFHPELMKQQAHELYNAANDWLNEFQKSKEALGY